MQPSPERIQSLSYCNHLSEYAPNFMFHFVTHASLTPDELRSQTESVTCLNVVSYVRVVKCVVLLSVRCSRRQLFSDFVSRCTNKFM